MRKGRRKVLGAVLMALMGAAAAAPSDLPGAAGPGRVTVEGGWDLPADAPATVELEAFGGRVLDVAGDDDPGDAGGVGPRRLGTTRSGRARARVEAPIGSALLVRAAGQVVRV